MRHFSPQQLQDFLAAGGQPLLLDVREPWEFEYCHIEGSELIPMGRIHQHLDDISNAVPVVVICHHGIRSRHVAAYLETQGFDDVINLEGGVERWAQEVEPGMRRY
ncbi:MAG: rhodanese-like domain-containing protein [Gammaproteobacteria bacterium]